MAPAPVSVSTDDIDALLPQTQCRRCEYPSCRAYAEAIAGNEAPFNRCPPGGDATLTALARLLGRPALALDKRYGASTPLAIARIDEATCIGCTLCIQACPTDAIVGAPKLMHTVLADRCTGCELCLPPCPVDCIAMPPAGRVWGAADADRARRHFAVRNARLAADPAKRPRDDFAPDAARLRRRAAVDAALARARSRRAARSAVDV